MNIPNLPTDTLYKFMTVLGLVGVFFFSYRLDKIMSDFEKTNKEEFNFILKFSVDTASIKFKLNNNNKEIRSLKKSMSRYIFSEKKERIIVADVIEKYKDKEKREQMKFIYDYQDDILPYFKYKEKVEELEKQNMDLKTELQTLLVANLVYNTTKPFKGYFLGKLIFSTLLLLVSFSIFGSGFYYWGWRQLISDSREDSKDSKRKSSDKF